MFCVLDFKLFFNPFPQNVKYATEHSVFSLITIHIPFFLCAIVFFVMELFQASSVSQGGPPVGTITKRYMWFCQFLVQQLIGLRGVYCHSSFIKALRALQAICNLQSSISLFSILL